MPAAPAPSPATLRLVELSAQLPELTAPEYVHPKRTAAKRTMRHAGDTVDTGHEALHDQLRALSAAPAKVRSGAVVAGCLLLGVGVATLLQAGLGAGPWDVLLSGVAGLAGVSHGTAAAVGGPTAITVGWLLGARGVLGVGTLATVALIPPTVDAVRLLLPAAPGPVASMVMLAVGLVCLAVAITTLVSARLGVGAVEVLTTGLRAHGLSVRWSRAVAELGFCAVGWSLGGAVGVATIAIAVGLGPTIAWLLPADLAGGRATADDG